MFEDVFVPEDTLQGNQFLLIGSVTLNMADNDVILIVAYTVRMGYLARFRASLLKICCFKTAGRFVFRRECA